MFSFEEETTTTTSVPVANATIVDDDDQKQEGNEEEFTIQGDQQVKQQQQPIKQQYVPVETIDINYEKVKDWLVNRNFLPSDYVKQLKQIRGYIKHAFKELKDKHEEVKSKESEKPVTELLEKINQLSQESQDELAVIDYFITKEIVQVLEKADSSEGSGYLFGLVGGSKRLKLWKHVLQSYEANNLHLAEISGYIIQNVKYEIPSMSSSLLSLRNQLESIDRKEDDWKRSLEIAKREFTESCEKLSINREKIESMIQFASSGSSVGVDIEDEIKSAVSDLPQFYENIVVSCKDAKFKKAVDYYEDFTSFFNKNKVREDLTCLKFVLSNLEKSTLSMYDWKLFNNQSLPSVDEEKVQSYIQKLKDEESKKANKSNEPQIDFGDFEFSTEGNVEINWDTGVEENKEIEIKFDDVAQEKELEIDFGDFSTDDVGGFSMDSVDISSNTNDEDSIKLVAELRMKSFLDDEDVRALFSNNLFQLYAFVQQRVIEVTKNSSLDSEIFSSAPNSIKSITKEEIQNLMHATGNVVTTLNNHRFKQLILIKTSKKFVERLVQSLTQKLEIMSKTKTNLEGVDSQRSSLNNSIKNQQPTVLKIKKQTKDYQDFIQKNLSEKLGKRVVIFGEINKI
ncbi:DUF773 domain-containing protein [Naegleria gruberi]|uniref:DUF773 domain-containing protein n=1 Tax=Naegleria gruberi TaxID=5762 RepID=D2V277_NAEGR|nr:DUF773 domain-containing protein [Naegleria gruberi]EFC48855.1 DUF773 domain-containing protein [Naegleria gruberi]|eukprot:XP_002681599.1 DUF773 domain-containing protein [Naegleria gruberi strain NEG-M]